MTECDFLFAALAEKHNTVIRKIREIPPWEWGGEFLELEPQVLRFLGTFAKRHPECAAFKTAHTLAAALDVYRLTSRKPKSLTKQERAICIAANRDLVDEYSDARKLTLEYVNESGVTTETQTTGVCPHWVYNWLVSW